MTSLAESLHIAWTDCFHRDSSTSVLLHPNVAWCKPQEGEQPPVIYAQWSHERDALATVGVLYPDVTRVRLIPGLPWRLKLPGLYLAADRLLGEQSEGAIDRFLEAVEQLLMSERFDCLMIEGLDVESPLGMGVARLRSRHIRAFRPKPPCNHWWIDFPENPQDYWKSVSNKRRKDLSKRAASLGARLIHHREPGDVPRLLESAGSIMAKSWKSNALGKFIASDSRACAYWQRIAALGALRSYTLERPDGRPVAFMRSTQWNGTLFLDQTAYDPEFAKDSPGLVLLSMILEDAIASDTPRCVDFGIGDYEYKRHFATRSTLQGPVVLVPRRLRPLAVMYVDQVRRRAHQMWRAMRRMASRRRSRT